MKHTAKYLAISLASLSVILAGSYIIVGGQALLISLAVIAAVVLIFGTFSLGIWYAHKSIQLGAKIATEAQNNNDKWDTVKTESLAKFGQEILKIKGQSSNGGYLALSESNGDTYDGDFIIKGLDD